MTLGRAIGKMNPRNIFANAEMWNQGVKKKKFDVALGGYEVGAGIDQPAIAQMMNISPQATMAYIQFENADMERKRAEKERKRQRTIAGKEFLTKAFGNLDINSADFPQNAKRVFGMYLKQYPEDAKAMQQMFGNDEGKMVAHGKFFYDLAHKDQTKAEKETAGIKKRTLGLKEKKAEIDLAKARKSTAAKAFTLGEGQRRFDPTGKEIAAVEKKEKPLTQHQEFTEGKALADIEGKIIENEENEAAKGLVDFFNQNSETEKYVWIKKGIEKGITEGLTDKDGWVKVTWQDIQALFKAGKLTREEAADILEKDFGIERAND